MEDKGTGRSIIETERLYLREMTRDDLPALSAILQDDKTMYAYEGAFSDEETLAWLNRQLERYREDGFGLWAVILKETGAMIGQAGITLQNVDGEIYPEIGYLFNRQYWKKGYAIEAAKGCKSYGFHTLGLEKLVGIVRDINIPSMNVAIRNEMVIWKRIVKHYKGIDMAHFVFVVCK